LIVVYLKLSRFSLPANDHKQHAFLLVIKLLSYWLGGFYYSNSLNFGSQSRRHSIAQYKDGLEVKLREMS